MFNDFYKISSSGKNISTIWNLEDIHKHKFGSLNVTLNGHGIKIAVLDTGFFKHHKFFNDKEIQEWNFFKDPGKHHLHDSAAITFPDNHCTAIVGLILQVAPKAKVYVMRVAPKAESIVSESHAENILAALDHIINMDNDLRPDIVSMSFGLPYEKYSGRKWENRFDELDRLGTICVAAAGNFGKTSDIVPVPACFTKVIPVGSLDENDRKSGYTPDVSLTMIFAPGDKLNAPSLPQNYDGSELSTADICPEVPTVQTVTGKHVAKEEWSSFKGTSMATAMLAGLLALLLQFADCKTGITKCAKIRSCSQIINVLTTHIQKSPEAVRLDPFTFFKLAACDLDLQHLFQEVP